MTDDDFLTVTQAAKALQTANQTIRNWIYAGTIKYEKVGSRYRIPRSEIDRITGSEDQYGESPWDDSPAKPFKPLVRRSDGPPGSQGSTA